MDLRKQGMTKWMRIMVAGLILAASLAASVGLGEAQAPIGTIAYVVGDTHDEIRLIKADGSNDRRLWISPVSDPSEVYGVWSLAWKPDGTELTFASNHESWCSLNNADIYAIQAFGSNYRRLTEAPSCAGLAGYAQGRVQVPVRNAGASSFSGFVYLQGANGIQPVNLPPFGTAVVTFENVADFGPGDLQVAAFMQGSYREIDTGTAVDVQAGETVTAGQLDVWELSMYSVWEVHSPTWRFGSDQVAYVLNFNSVRQVPSNPAALDFGTPLLNADSTAMPDFVQHLAYGPTAATAGQLLYNGNESFNSEGIYQVSEGSSTPGTLLVSYESYESILGLAWLPDGSGFVYSVREYSEDYLESANMFVYRFAGGGPQRLTNFSGEFTGRLAVSPDGQKVVFERGDTLTSLDVESPDLWMMGLDGSGLALFKTNGRSPVWTPVEVKGLADLNIRLYLPQLQR